MIDIYDRTIFERRNILSGEYCKDIIQKYESDQSKHPGRALGQTEPGGIVMDHISDIKKCMDLPLRNNGPWGEYTKKIHLAVRESIYYYVKHQEETHLEEFPDITAGFYTHMGDIEFTNPQIARYDPGGYFKWHSDQVVDGRRLLAVIIYLNDIDEEMGGFTEFNSGRKVQPEAGKLLMFPTTPCHVHRGCVVKSGCKYIITMFINISPSVYNSSRNFITDEHGIKTLVPIIDVYDKSIYECKNVCSLDFCNHVIQAFKDSPYKRPGKVGSRKYDGGVLANVKKSTDLEVNPDHSAVWKHIHDEMMHIFYESFHKYLKHIKVLEKTHEDTQYAVLTTELMDTGPTSPQIQHSTEGDFYQWHSDQNSYSPMTRYLSFILYLNDVEEDAGGTTEFNNGRKVKPEAGKVLIFPADFFHVHRGNVVKKGDKYIVTSFLVRDHELPPAAPSTVLKTTVNKTPFIFS